MPAELIPVEPGHVPEIGRICHLAFNTLHERHRVRADVPTEEVGQLIVGACASRSDYVGVVAVESGRVIGSNFLLLADEVAGVGPITVDPTTQSVGVGRLLMQWAIDESRRRGVRQVRLFQEAINTTSLSLYTKLGFRWRLAATLMQPEPASADDPTIRPLAPADLPYVEQLSKRHYGFSRAADAAQLLNFQLPAFVRERGGQVVGYQIATLFGHAAAETTDDLLALVAHTARRAEPPMAVYICPLTEQDLFRQALTSGHRVLKVLNYMSLETYEPPQGNWLPSIQC